MCLSMDLSENDLSYRDQKFSFKMLFNSQMSFPLQNVFLFTLFPFFHFLFFISHFFLFPFPFFFYFKNLSKLRLSSLPHHSQPFWFSWGKFHLIVSTCKQLPAFKCGFILTCFRGTVLICASTTHILFLACKCNPACTVELPFGQMSPSIKKPFIVKKKMVLMNVFTLGLGGWGVTVSYSWVMA